MPTDNAFHIYIDETSKAATYMGVGALFRRRDAGRAIAQMIHGKVVEFEQRPDKELHWSALTRHLLPLYKAVGLALIDCTQVKPYRMRYHAMMIETAKIDRSINEGLNREQVLERFIFALIFNFAHNFGPMTEYHVFIDSKSGEEGSDEALRAMLNNRCFTRFKKRTAPFHTVKYVRSENSRLIQAVDLLSGAVAYETNSLHRAAKPAKHRLELWSSMLQASNLITFAQPTTDRMNRFQILHFDFEKSAANRFKPLPPPASDDE
jgi:hypothetical protein